MNKISITLSLPTTKYPSENIDAYSQKEEEELYKKGRLIPCSSNTNTTKKTPKIYLFQKQYLQEGNSAQSLSSSDHGS
jgi:hypothetical protein